MTKESIFEVWAPPRARWSRWVKPVLFACMDSPPPEPEGWHEPEVWDVSWAPAAPENVALVLDLPGRAGVVAGLALAQRGYRPVPLYNALQGPAGSFDPTHPIAAATVVDVRGIITEILRGTDRLTQVALADDAPPVFLLDWDRRGEGRPRPPRSFDNRSVSFTTDFPSSNFLLAHGVRRAVLVQPSGEAPQSDLAHTLRRWQEAGVTMELKRLDVAGVPVPVRVPKPSWFGWVWQRALLALGLRPAKRGGFGGWVPEPSSG